MSELNLKLKTYDELVLEISRLNIDKYLLEQKLEQKENIIKEVRNWINSTIDIIKQQPTGNDEWILERLNSFISLLDKGE